MNKRFSSNFPTRHNNKFYRYTNSRMSQYQLSKKAVEFSASLKDQVISQLDNSFVFEMPDNIYDMISRFNLHQILKNDRTSIYENDSARFSVDKKVVRVLLFDENNKNLLEQIRSYFYGQEYDTI